MDVYLDVKIIIRELSAKLPLAAKEIYLSLGDHKGSEGMAWECDNQSALLCMEQYKRYGLVCHNDN